MYGSSNPPADATKYLTLVERDAQRSSERLTVDVTLHVFSFGPVQAVAA